MMKKFFLSVVIFIAGLGTYLFFYLGAYKSVQIEISKRGPLHLLYKPHAGAYHQIGDTIREVETQALAQNLDCTRTFGEYLDNPDSVDQDRLRSRGGCVLTAKPEHIPAEYQYEERPTLDYVVGHFSGSPAIGPFKVYPKVKTYLQEHRLVTTEATIEIYTVDGPRVATEYLFALGGKSLNTSH